MYHKSWDTQVHMSYRGGSLMYKGFDILCQFWLLWDVILSYTWKGLTTFYSKNIVEWFNLKRWLLVYLVATNHDELDTYHCLTVTKVSKWCTLQWRHNERIGLSNHQPHGCLLNRLFGSRSKKTSKLRVTGLCAGKSPGTGEFLAQMASNAEHVSIWWRHHAYRSLQRFPCS